MATRKRQMMSFVEERGESSVITASQIVKEYKTSKNSERRKIPIIAASDITKVASYQSNGQQSNSGYNEASSGSPTNFGLGTLDLSQLSKGASVGQSMEFPKVNHRGQIRVTKNQSNMSINKIKAIAGLDTPQAQAQLMTPVAPTEFMTPQPDKPHFSSTKFGFKQAANHAQMVQNFLTEHDDPVIKKPRKYVKRSTTFEHAPCLQKPGEVTLEEPSVTIKFVDKSWTTQKERELSLQQRGSFHRQRTQRAVSLINSIDKRWLEHDEKIENLKKIHKPKCREDLARLILNGVTEDLNARSSMRSSIEAPIKINNVVTRFSFATKVGISPTNASK